MEGLPMMEGIDAQVAYTGAAGLSLVSSFCLLLVNLGAPIIEGIYIASVDVKTKYSSVGKIIVGVYGICAKLYNSYFTSNGSSSKCASLGLDNNGDDRNGSTKFLLAMHAIGVITSFMLFSVGMYARANNPIPNKAAWIFAIFSSFVILLAIGGQIDNYIKIKETDDDYTKTTIGASGLIPVILALLCSLISIFAFYTAEQAAANTNINGPENPEAINNQPPVSQYQQPINQPPVAQYGNQQFPPQYGEYNNFQSPPPQPYQNSQYGDQYKQNPYSNPPPPQSPQPYTAYQPYSGTDHEPVMM